MKIQYLLIPLALAGCGTRYPSMPNTALIVDSHTTQMSRNDIINGVHECETSGLRPVIITTRRKINGFISDAPVDVTCYPDQKRYNKIAQ
jgi:hypothetical protein